MKLLFHGPPTSKITFSRPLVTTTVCHVFFTPLNKTQPTAYSKIPLAKSLIIHKPVNCSVNRIAVFYIVQIESYF